MVYIAPLKALVRERIDDWKVRLEARLGYQVIELTGIYLKDLFSFLILNLFISYFSYLLTKLYYDWVWKEHTKAILKVMKLTL